MEFIYIWLIFLCGMLAGAGVILMFATKIISAMTEELKNTYPEVNTNDHQKIR